ncbi:hypothetical protein ACPPVW_10695 [Leifsonia sp. McL0607]|uniref:hypothetical protein n=1 Tax=Leifsonia sp. McL0607 TaxID=3415672 RepID=UPI003CF30044
MTALDVVIDVVIDRSAAPDTDLTDLVESWSWCRAPRGTSPAAVLVAELDPRAPQPAMPDWSLLARQRFVIAARTVPELSELLSSAVTRIAIERRSDAFTLLHAAGLSHPTSGAVAALVGPSGAGKSTAAQVLGRTLGYLSDEVVAVGRSRRVLPFAKPISIVDHGRPWKRQAHPDALGMTRHRGELRLRRLVVLDRHREHSGAPEAWPLDVHTAAESIVPNVSSFGRSTRSLAALTALMTECGGVIRVRYRDAEDLPPLMLRLLDDAALVQSVARARVDDEVWIGETCYLQLGLELVALAGVGALVWRMLEAPCPERILAEGVVAELASVSGNVSDLAHVERVIGQLVERGVLVKGVFPDRVTAPMTA